MATKTAQNTNLKERRDQVINTVKSVNCMFVDMADDLIEGTITTGTKYQKLAANAIKKSEPIIEKQVDMVFDTIEMAIDQLQSNNKRFQKLLGITKQVDMATEKISQIAKRVSDKVEDQMEEAGETLKSTISRTKATTQKQTATAKKQVKRTVKTVKKETKAVVKTAQKEVKAATPKRTVGRPRKSNNTK